MAIRRLTRWLRILAICLAVDPAGFAIHAVPVAAVGMFAASGADARAPSSSGGYSRPGGSFSSGGYRPSVGGSGGYGRPSVYGGSGGYGAFSGGDRAISRRNSGQAFQQYQTPRPPPSAPPSGSSAWGGGWSAPVDRRPPVQGYLPGFGGAPNRRFGVWDGLLLGALLSSLSQPGHARFFYDNQNDPGYAQWRADADRAAQRDPAVAQKLAELDARLAELQGQPRNPGAPPPNVAPQAAPAQESAGGGSGLVFLVLFLGAGVFVLLWLRRRRTARATPAIAGSAETRFRVGMTIPVDPAPFLLAAGKTKVRPPEGGGMVSIEAVGLVSDRGVLLHRLYLPGREAFFVLHLGPDGTPDECRYFSQLDEVTPATQAEWGFWLDPAEGMIGWPEFQTKDGKVYGRAWSPGGSRVAPRQQSETVQDLRGSTQRQLMAMLYAGSTGAAPPAPATEYVLVCAVQAQGSAWVEVHAGIDINPAALQLPAVPLTS